MNFVAKLFGKEGTQWTISQPAKKDSIFAGPPFTAEETAGNTTGGVQSLLVVYAEGEEVNPLAGLLRGGSCCQQHSVASTNDNSAPCLTGEFAGLKDNVSICDMSYEPMSLNRL
jgi:hypothetical protein